MSVPVSSQRTNWTSIGIALLVGGIVFVVIGLWLFFAGWGVMGGGSSLQGMGFLAVGFLLVTFSIAIIQWANVGRVASYVARETTPAMITASTAFGRGLQIAGGIPPGLLQNPAPQVVKIRCRHCGYLETEDAKFCSNCGNPP